MKSTIVSALGKGEAKSSILFGSTSFSLTYHILSAFNLAVYSATIGGTHRKQTSGPMENPWTDVLNVFRGNEWSKLTTSH